MEPADDTALLKASIFRSHKLAMMLQAEAAEYGLACLAMVAAYHGHRRSLSELRRLFSASIKGTTLKSLMDMADGLGFTARPVRLEVSELKQLARPALLHWDLKHYVVLWKAGRNWIEIHAPARGKRKLMLPEVERSFTGVAQELMPTANFRQKKEAMPVPEPTTPLLAAKHPESLRLGFRRAPSQLNLPNRVYRYRCC